MRFLRILIVSLLVLFSLAGVVLISYTSIFLWWEAKNLASTMQRLVALAIDPSLAHRSYCKPSLAPLVPDESSQTPYGVIMGYQLRFVDDKAYVIEMVCRDTTKQAVNLSKGSLKLTRKTSGSGVLVPVGLYTKPVLRDRTIEPLNGYVLVGYGTQQRLVGFINNTLTNTLIDNPPLVNLDIARSVCQGFGHSCCNSIAEVGEGKNEPLATDCPNSCFATCTRRPTVLFFNTDPRLDSQTRRLEVREKEAQVTFGFEIVAGGRPVSVTRIEYGDGTGQQLTSLNEAVSHYYRCNNSYCEFEAKLVAEDTAGIGLAASRFGLISIILNTTD